MSTEHTQTISTDVLVVGSGPIGSAVARRLVEGGRHVLMIDAGPKLSERPGAHLKNAYLYQRNLDLFADIIRGHLHLVSVPPDPRPEITLDPGAFMFDPKRYGGFVQNTQNPDQDPRTNLDAAAVTYGVGGMATHWTCAIPRHHPTVERHGFLSDQQWDELYTEAEQLLNLHTDVFEHSVRHQIVRDALRQEYPELTEPYHVQNLPLAVERRQDNPNFVHWSGADTVLGPLADGAHADRFELRPQHLCRRLVPSSDGSRILYAEVQDLENWRTLRIEADQYFVACNAINTPQLLWASGIRPEPLGRWLTEQPVAFCQIVLRHDLVEAIEADARFTERVRTHRGTSPHDPVPIPGLDPEPNVWIPVSEDRPWHCQIHRDAFNYGDIAPNVDTRLVVDLRWFGLVEPRPDNRVWFSERFADSFGMPQPTFEFTLSREDRDRQHRMMRDMLRAANVLGGFLRGSEPQFVSPGLPLHFAGTIRMGDDPATSVVDADSRVWNIDNLFLGGNGLVPTSQASNPTLTSVAMAVQAARGMLGASRA
ncbi:MAG: pyranose oxidase [Candidatus Dormiibacterota bacterium]